MANQPSSSPLDLFDAEITTFTGAELFKNIENVTLLKPVLDIVAGIRELLKNVTPEDVQNILEHAPGHVAERVSAIVTNTDIGELEESGIKTRIMKIVGRFFKNILDASTVQSHPPVAPAAPQRKVRGPYKKRRAKAAPTTSPDTDGKDLPPEEFERYIASFEAAIRATMETANTEDNEPNLGYLDPELGALSPETLTIKRLSRLTKTVFRCMPFMLTANQGKDTISISGTKALMAYKFQRDAAVIALHRVCPKVTIKSAVSFYAWAAPGFTDEKPADVTLTGTEKTRFELVLEALEELKYPGPGAEGRTIKELLVD